MVWSPDAVMAADDLAAVAAARSAVREAQQRLDEAGVGADAAAAETGWASPAASAFRARLASWRDEVRRQRRQLDLVDDELARAWTAQTGPVG